LRELPRSGKAKKGGKPLSIRKRGFGQDAAPLTQTGLWAKHRSLDANGVRGGGERSSP